jgi:hypothetical protein
VTRWVALVALALACGDEGDGLCFFDGKYEIGFLAQTPGCGDLAASLSFFGQTDECSTTIDTLTVDGLTRRRGAITCDPGQNPIVECSGFANDSDGCSFEVYVRRVGSP